MFRITIRDLLWLMAVVGLSIALWQERKRAENEKQLILKERDAAVANERRIADLKAREIAGTMISLPGQQARSRRAEKFSSGAIVAD